MSEQIDYERLARYVSGEATASEVEEIGRWAADNAEHQRLLASLEMRWRAAAPTASFDVDRAWQRLAPKLGQADGTRGKSLSFVAPKRPAIQPWMYALAASLLLAIGLSSRLLPKGDEAKADVLGALAGLDAQTGIGERREVELPDGSKAVLGVRSTLRFEPSLAKAPRIIHLVGEAFFTVEHDPTRTFRVLAGNVVTEDIGTEFSVRAYSGEQHVRVAVREGAVAVSRQDEPSGAQPILLGQRDVALVAAEGEPKVTSDSLVERLFAWRNGDLVFENASLAEVASELSRWYDVDIRFADPELASRHLTSSFKSDPIDEVLRVIGLSAEVRFERRGRLVTVYAAPRTSNGDPVGPRGSNVAARSDGGVEGGV